MKRMWKSFESGIDLRKIPGRRRAGATHVQWGVLSGKAHGRKASAHDGVSDETALSDVFAECVLTFAPANFFRTNYFAVCNPKPISTSPLKQGRDATIGTKQM